MNTQLILSIGIIFGAFAFWVLIQESARRFARRHPEFGPAREEGGECGISCSCANWKNCKDRNCASDRSDRSDGSDRSDR
jgi:hypothetical protein